MTQQTWHDPIVRSGCIGLKNDYSLMMPLVLNSSDALNRIEKTSIKAMLLTQTKLEKLECMEMPA